MRVAATIVFILFATPTFAYCPNPSGIVPENYVNDVADFLVCLHNEQTDSINEIKAMVNAHSEGLNELDSLRRKIIELEARIAILEDHTAQ